MENEELFAGEPAMEAQQLARDGYRTSDVTPLRVHHEPLLPSAESDGEWTGVRPSDDTDSRPRWRRAHVGGRL